MPQLTRPPIEKIPAKDIKLKWSDYIEVTMSGGSSDLPKVKEQTIAAMNYIQSHVFTDAHYQGNTPASLDGQGLLYELSQYHALFKKNPDLVKKFENMGLMRNGKFVIEIHDQNFVSQETGSNTIFVGADAKSKPLPVKIRVGVDYLKGSQILGQDGKWHAATLEGVLVNELAHLTSQSQSEELSNVYENCVLAGFGQPKRDVKSERAIFNRNQNGKVQTLHDSPTGKKFAALIDPQTFPDFKPDADAPVLAQATGQKPLTEVKSKS